MFQVMTAKLKEIPIIRITLTAQNFRIHKR